MLDREGYRPNVGIVLLNARNEVFWGKRIGQHSWQFPQGGIAHGESPEEAMYRELHEEVGLFHTMSKLLDEPVIGFATMCLRSFCDAKSITVISAWPIRDKNKFGSYSEC